MPSDAPAWSLHSQLKKDTIDIGDLPLCRVLVIKDAQLSLAAAGAAPARGAWKSSTSTRSSRRS